MNKALGLGLLAVSTALWVYVNYHLFIMYSSRQLDVDSIFFLFFYLLDDNLMSQAKTRFLKITGEEVDFAHYNGVKIALESFCYSPFILADMQDFMQFISRFRSSELGVLLEVGHLYQAGFNLDEAIRVSGHRIFDVHDAILHDDYKSATHLPIGRENIDFTKVITSLRKIKYDGWLTWRFMAMKAKSWKAGNS